LSDSVESRYPSLFAPARWDNLEVRFELCDVPPPEERINNVNGVPFVGEGCLLVRLASGEWDIPGGTKEDGETHLEAAARELREEAGAHLISFKPFGAWHCLSGEAKPWRAHLAHPEFYRLVGYGQVERIGDPLNPTDGERIIEVSLVKVEEAARLLRESGRADLAELYLLAAELRGENESGR
jgi:8-oxo-dGTP diphosphatase